MDKRHSEAGVAMIILAIFLFALAAMLAITMDVYRMSVSHSQLRTTAQLAALSALEAYRESTATDEAGKLQDAVERAEIAAGLPKNSLFGTNNQTVVRSGSSDLQDGSAGSVVPGVFFFDEPNGENGCESYTGPNNAAGCPCGRTGDDADFRPCFLAQSEGATQTLAFEVRLNTRSDSPVRHIFGPLIGQEKVDLAASGRASMVPRHGLFAIDMSGSMAAETHFQLSGLPASQRYKASQYVFRVYNKTCSGGGNPCAALGSNCQFSPDANDDQDKLQKCVWYGGTARSPSPYDGGANITCAGMEEVRPAARQPRWRHYRNDYTCWNVDVDGDGTSEVYLIDTATHPYTNEDGSTGTYIGPEPLMSVLAGIHEALNIVEQRSVAGDRIGAFAFDETVADKRTGGEKSGGRIYNNLYPGLDHFDDLKDITDVTGTTSAQLSKRINAGFFPLPNANTDVPLAIFSGTKLFEEMDNSELSQNYVAMFTDGLNSCRHDGPRGDMWEDFMRSEDGENVRLGTQKCLIPPDFVSDGETLREWRPSESLDVYYRSYNHHRNGLWEAAALVGGFSGVNAWNTQHASYMKHKHKHPSYVDSKIAFHSFMFGDVAPAQTRLATHTTDRNRCLDDENAREAGMAYSADWTEYYDDRHSHFWWVNAHCFQTMFEPPDTGGRCPYVAHHYFFYKLMSVPTGGFFVPVRPPCSTASLGIDPAACASGNLQNMLDAKCTRGTGTTGGNVVPISNTDPIVTAGVVDNTMGRDFNTGTNTWSVLRNENGDVSPRVACDTLCRTKQQQIVEYVQKIYGQSPYIIVDEHAQ